MTKRIATRREYIPSHCQSESSQVEMTATMRTSAVLRIGAGLGVLGGTAALLDLLFAGCIATGPCQPVPPVPIVLPVLFLVVGAALILISILHGRSKTG